jgi:manganese transport protein
LPYLAGLAVAACDTFLLLAVQRRGVRLLELLTLGLVAVVAGSFLVEIILARPDWAAVARGFLPGLAAEDTRGSLYVAIAMLGATVMPHNLYLHSALVQTRAFPHTPEGKTVACRGNLLDSTVALNAAFLVNAAILVLAASAFPHEVSTLGEAHNLLHLVWGTTLASFLFAIALLASGQSSTLTGTLAGQVVMEGFVRLRLRPWVRRLLTRAVAILPALLLLAFAGQYTDEDRQETAVAVSAPLAATGPLSATALAAAGHQAWKTEPVDKRLLQLLVLSQAVLSLQLPFAVLPLVQLTSDRRRMGEFASGPVLKALAWACAAVVIALNAVLIVLQMREWAEGAAEGGGSGLWVYGSLGPVVLALALFLAWVGLYPVYFRRARPADVFPPPAFPPVRYQRIGVAVEFAGADEPVLAQAAALARAHEARLFPIHVVEGPGAAYHGPATADQESRSDRQAMAELLKHLRDGGLAADGLLGYGEPPRELVRLAREQQLDLLVLGTHGHRFFADLALGQTVSPVLHRLAIPVLVVPTGKEASRQTRKLDGASPVGE